MIIALISLSFLLNFSTTYDESVHILIARIAEIEL